MQIRSILVSVGFVAALAVVADLAWATAVGTTGPWFSPEVSLQVYVMAVGGASILALALVGIAATRAARLDEEVQGLNLVISRLHGGSGSRAARPRADAWADLEMSFSPESDALAGPGVAGSDYVAIVESMTREALAPGVPAGRPVDPEVVSEFLEERRRLLRARASVWTPVAGPAVASIAFVLSAGAMLPAAEGYAVENFRTNTTLVLFLAYGWAFLLAWAIVAILLLHALPRRRTAMAEGGIEGVD